MIKEKNIVVFFDGVCNLCNGFVNFIIKRDSKAKIKFASLQSNYAKLFLQNYTFNNAGSNSVIVLIDDTFYVKSTAAILLLYELGGCWKAIKIFYIIPKCIRDFFYTLIAKNRYKIFGKTETCIIPSSEITSRFL